MRIRSGYSFHAATGHLSEVVSRIKEIGWTVAPLADRNSTFGFVEHTKLSKEAGLRPIYGVEIGVTAELGKKKPVLDYWTFYARDSLRQLHDLVARSTDNPGKEPCLLYSEAVEARGVVKITGESVLLDHVPDVVPDLFVSLSPGTPLATYKLASKRGIQFIETSCPFYPRKGDQELYRMLMGSIRSDNRSYPQHILDHSEWTKATWFASNKDKAEASENLDYATGICKAKLRKASLLVPEKPMTLRQMAEEGARKLGVDLTDPVYAERLDRELAMIKQKNFEDYFYILADVINDAKKKMVVGPARGSSAGSLVCYLIGITSIDPIPFGLFFERFVDINRMDMPDVDIDFSDDKRHLAFEYMEEKYGKDRVARLGSVSLFKPRSALDKVGVSLRIPQWQIDKVSEGAIKRAGGDSRASSTIEDTLNETEAGREVLKQFPEIKIVTRMEDHPSNAGKHAAGMVLTNEPITEFVAVNTKTGSAMCDKYDSDALGLLKIDALGLTQLSIFERTMEMIGVKPVSGWLEKLPLDDPAAFAVLNEKKFNGVFQFVGSASQGITGQITVENFDDLAAITALARPGPLASGGTDAWIRRRTGREPVTYSHPIFEPYLKETFGIPIYQEQILRIGREVGDLSWEDVTKLRQAMSRSLGKEYFDQFGDRWKRSAAKKGVPPEVLEKVWDDMCQFGAWAFNKAHSVAYAMVGYWCCWFKAHHPFEFAAATLDSIADPAKQINFLRELRDEQIHYIPFDPDISDDRWRPTEKDGRKVLVGPLTNIEGIGPATMLEILDARKNGIELRSTIAKKLEGARTKIDSLTPIADAFRRKFKDLASANINTTPTNIVDVQPGIRGEVVIIAVVKKIIPTDDNAPVKVAKRGGKKVADPSTSLNTFFFDDTDEIFCKVHRRDFERIGREIINQGGEGASMWIIKGTVPRDFRMIWVSRVAYLGRVDE